MSYPLEPITSVNTSLSDKYFDLEYPPEEEIPEMERIKFIRRAEPINQSPVYANADIDQDYLGKQKIFDAVKDLYLSYVQTNRQIADRLITLHRDALTEDQHIHPDSIPQFAEFFLMHSDVGLPKITLTPDGTLRARWIHGSGGNFLAIEFTGEPLVKVVAEIPRGAETARYFFSEPVQNVAAIARSIGASFC